MNDHSDAGGTPRHLSFETDRGASRSIWIAAGLVLAIVLWMGSGFVLPSEDPEPVQQTEAEPPAVVVRETTAEPVTLRFSAEGQALPERDTVLSAEASGTVAALPVARGDTVEAGDVVARLSAAQADATLAQAEEERTRAQRELDNARQLLERGAGTVDRVSEAQATLAAAEAQVATAEQALDNLVVTAPFPGRIESLPINDGEYLAIGDEVARLVDNSPLTVAIQVPQQSLARIRTGQPATVDFITGQTREGEVTFVGTAAVSETRTFLVEIEVPNEDGEIPAGISAEVTIPTGERQAHFVRPSIISLDPDGALGIKTVEDGRVKFQPVEIVSTAIDGVWVTGLEDTATIITVGQGFVRDGEAVRAQPQEEAGGALAAAPGDEAMPAAAEATE
ncbi:membrane fusion protein, multidrug efflux system [Roseivivax marinus]|uniref:efflux RND transporter periplasmic adaptor subunit n=1 Tax=Roseivivax marinus TaxID=1379903 RepID=UPI0008AFACAD|nr:efflux RND transporter periplasmic adaptor subunit [Roseivivax marinus]SEK75817.1 membrane fusion protein, multidrug efflux system [Roseivivax marinus]